MAATAPATAPITARSRVVSLASAVARTDVAIDALAEALRLLTAALPAGHDAVASLEGSLRDVRVSRAKADIALRRAP